MPRFLHIADIHLGYDRYDNKVRTQDFYYAFQDVVEQYAIAQQVDFVLIAGDLFEHRNIQPNILNQAQLCLNRLQEAGIPVLAIEGNHDNRPYGTRTSWLKYLSGWGALKLLEPGDVAAGEALYEPWDEENRCGGYIDLGCGVRVIGSYWYGSAAPQAIKQLAEAIAALPAGPQHTVLMFHHGLEGQIARYQGALRYADLLPLKQAGVDYLALGHIHKSYAVEGWVFNPGSLEANSIEESAYARGAYLVEINEAGIHAELKQNYRQRSIVRLRYTLTGQESVEAVEEGAIATIQAAIASNKLNPAAAPIVELRLEGTVGFDRLDLDVRQLQQHLQQISGALICLLRYDVDEAAYASPIAEDASRLQIEQEVFTDLLAAHTTYKKRAAELARGLIDLKDRQLEGRSEPEIYQFVEDLLFQEER
ncbi:MAG TPA: DNA repair exonuclease [Synechococcales cyanobacterium M55_K2018_004]|nr:DNA repair exonuclease [Synechococcales cyanobacterium M55_K2018_004]